MGESVYFPFSLYIVMSEFLYTVLYYLNAETVSFWIGFKHNVALCAVFNLLSFLMILTMENEETFPRVVYEYPFKFFFPMKISGVILLCGIYTFLVCVLPDLMIGFLQGK